MTTPTVTELCARVANQGEQIRSLDRCLADLQRRVDCLVTTLALPAMRLGYYSVRIVWMSTPHAVSVECSGLLNVTLGFNREVPNGNGLIVLDVNRAKVKLNAWTTMPDAGPAPNLGEPTSKLAVQFSPSHIGVKPEDLRGLDVRLYSHDWPPEVWERSP